MKLLVKESNDNNNSNNNNSCRIVKQDELSSLIASNQLKESTKKCSFILKQQQQQQQQHHESIKNNQLNNFIPEIPMKLSPVHKMFYGQSIFITGASGFIGRVLLEKLLRTYVSIKTVYILMRTKKNQLPSDRLHKQLLNVPIFDTIRSMKNGQEILNKIQVIPGDIAKENLGISEQDMNRLISDQTLSIVFHSAATIKFDEPLRTSIKLNLAATQAIIDLCKQLPNLIALCHVSTAYVNSDIQDGSPIDEKIYPFKDDPEQLINLANILDDDLMQVLKPRLVDERPNTYTYTKAAAESLMFQRASELPVAIVRPSIVVGAWKEPLPGWVDNLAGPTGMIVAIGKGLLRTMHCNTKMKADIIPVDIVVNTMISSVYYTAKINNTLPLDRLDLNYNNTTTTTTTTTITTTKKKQNNITCFNGNSLKLITNKLKESSEKCNGICINNDDNNLDDKKKKKNFVVHCNSGDLNPLTWGVVEKNFFSIIREYPSNQVFRYPSGTLKSNKYHDYITRIFVHLLPALLVDLFAGMFGKKPGLFNIYIKIHQALGALSHFTAQNYNFQTKNLKILEQALEHPLDQEQLFMSVDKLDWNPFWYTYVLGCRKYILKESNETLLEARKSMRRAFWMEIFFRVILIALMAICLYFVL